MSVKRSLKYKETTAVRPWSFINKKREVNRTREYRCLTSRKMCLKRLGGVNFEDKVVSWSQTQNRLVFEG